MEGSKTVSGSGRTRFATYGAAPLDVSKGAPASADMAVKARGRDQARQAAPSVPTNHLHGLTREVMGMIFNRLDAASRVRFSVTEKRTLDMYRTALKVKNFTSPSGFSYATIAKGFQLAEQRLQAVMQRVQDTPKPSAQMQLLQIAQIDSVAHKMVESFGVEKGVDARDSSWKLVAHLVETIAAIVASENHDQHIAALATSSDSKVQDALAGFVRVAALIYQEEAAIKTKTFGVPTDQIYEQAHIRYRKGDMLFPNLERKGLLILQGILDAALHRARQSPEIFEKHLPAAHVDEAFMKLADATALALAQAPEPSAVPKSKARSFLGKLNDKFSPKKS